MKTALFIALLALASAAEAQVSPTPDFENPRLQTIDQRLANPIRLVAFPSTPLTLMFTPGERVMRANLSNPDVFQVSIIGAGDTLSILPLVDGATAEMTVTTNVRDYSLMLETGTGLSAAYVVRFTASQPMPVPGMIPPPPTPEPEVVGTYRLSGRSALRPSRISDDGERTYLEWGVYQSLPAVFGVASNGEEEVVDGYMRDGIFVIDRIYSQLVFRIDKERAIARRRVPGE